MDDIVSATRDFEDWLGKQTPLIPSDLAIKHANMSSSDFAFFRATFYRWAQLWPKKCKALAKAPSVLAVGDLHVENFGTWRDSEGRLIWGINDFDETAPMPYTIDLVRLAASASIAIKAEHLAVSIEDAFASILDGYHKGLKSGGQPFVLAENNGWLREPALGCLRDPERFWKKLNALPDVEGPIPDTALEALQYILPSPDIAFRIVHRIAGEGSLGRKRYVALADWHGSKIAREAKALLPSAMLWASQRSGPYEVHYTSLLNRAVRCPDPFLDTRGQWVVRRLAPDCSRVELSQLVPVKDEIRLLHVMGWETANIHLGSAKAIKDVREHLSDLPDDWLAEAATEMEEAITKDARTWRKAHPAEKDAA